jgi:WD40 repeat protein
VKRHHFAVPSSSWRLLSLPAIAALGGIIGSTLPSLQAQQAPLAGPSTADRPGGPTPPVGASGLAPAAYIHYLLALQFANDGIKHEALRELAESLRVQRDGNPAAGLAFQLIAEQRQDIHITLCCNVGNILIASFSPDGLRILTVFDDKTARIWDAHTGQPLSGTLRHNADILAAAWSLDGRYIATSSRDENVHLWDASTGTASRPPFHVEQALTVLALSPDGQRVLGGAENTAYLWNAHTGERLSSKLEYHEDVNAAAFSADGKYALLGTSDSVADLLDPLTGKRVLRLKQGNAIFSAKFSRDGRLVVTGSEDHTARIWDANTGMPLGPPLEHTAPISDAVFSADADRVLTTSYDHTARVWDAHTGHPLTPLLQHNAPLIDGGFNPDASLVFTHGRDLSIRVWSVRAGQLVLVPIRSTAPVSSACFSPTDSRLLVILGGTAQVLDMPPEETPPVWLADLAEFAASRSQFSQAPVPDRAIIEKLRTEMLASAATDPWTKFGKWYFIQSSDRTVSPWSTVSLEHYVNQLLSLNTMQSLEYARQIAFDHPKWILKIDAARKALSH